MAVSLILFLETLRPARAQKIRPVDLAVSSQELGKLTRRALVDPAIFSLVMGVVDIACHVRLLAAFAVRR